MKCILLSAGKGERLLPYTKTKPKCMIDLGKTNLMEIWLQKVKELNFDQIIINTHHLSNVLKDEINKISKRLNIKNISVYKEEKLLGTGGTLWSLQNKINDDFFVINTDVYAEISLEKIKDTFLSDKLDCLIACDYRFNTEGCGILKLSNDQIIDEFIEKEHDNSPGFVYSGILIFSQKIFKKLPFNELSKNNFIGLDTGYHVLPKILKTTKCYKINGKVIDLRDENQLIKLQKYLMNKFILKD
jgi:NDP-sugar pyrophosphorylase family protein